MRGLSAAPTRAVITVILLLIIGSDAAAVFAQVGSGTLTGVVRDQAGAVVSGAVITITNTDTSLQRLAVSGGAGVYTAAGLFDGISVLQPEPGQVAFFPIVDAIQEFKIESNSPSAAHSAGAGGAGPVD